MKLKTLPPLHLAAFSLLTSQIIPSIAFAQAQPAPPLSGVLGKVQSFTGSSLDVTTPAGVIHVKVTQPLATYKQNTVGSEPGHPKLLCRCAIRAAVGWHATREAGNHLSQRTARSSGRECSHR